MEQIAAFTPEQARALWQGLLSSQQHYVAPASQNEFAPMRERVVILDASLPVATNSKTGATSCLATVCYWSVSDEEFTEADPVQQITVWNHSESTAHAVDTFGIARWISGHWMFFGDCDPMASR